MPIDRMFGVGKTKPPSEPPDDTASDRKPIGVPEGYTTQIQRQQATGYYPHGYSYTTHRYGPGAEPSGRVTQGVRYRQGDEFLPAGASPDSIADLQRDMKLAGLIGPDTNIRYGVWDEPTRKAYQQLLSTSNARGMDANTTLNDMLAAPQSNPAGGTQGYQAPPLQIRTTNPDDLRRVMRKAVIDTLGEGWSQQQIDELVQAYNWKEIQVQKEAYDQTVALQRAAFEGGPGGGQITQVDVPSPETFVENEIRRRDPVGFQAGQMTQEFIPSALQNLQGWV